MDRKERMQGRSAMAARNLNETARMLSRILSEIDVPKAQREPFVKWAVQSLWKTFSEERMNERIIIENEIKNLGLRFPNGTVGQHYSHIFSLPLDRISEPEIEGAEELGLTFMVSPDGRCSLSGMPPKSGDFTLRLRYNTLEGEEPSTIDLPIAFNPNPRTLWKDIPTSRDIPYFKEDTDCQYITVDDDNYPKKDMVAASVRGRSHAQEGRPRDDHFSMYHSPVSDWYMIAVADGAGSAKYSRKGSEVACETAINHCKKMLGENADFEEAIKGWAADRDNATLRTEVTRQVIDIVYNGALKAHEAVKKAADANPEAKLRDFATTLMFAICKRYDFGWFVASFWVGDGAMCLYDEKAGTAKLLGTPDEGEYSGQTRFLTMPEIFHDREAVGKRLRMAIVPDFTALFLMSDGVSDPLFETDRNLNDFEKWKEFYERLRNGFPEDEIAGVDLTDNNAEAKVQLKDWLGFWSPGNHDDRTIAIIY